MGNTANVSVWASADGEMKSSKRCDYASSAELGERLFPNTADIYVYIYIYIYMKADKGVAEIKFCYLMFACEAKL